MSAKGMAAYAAGACALTSINQQAQWEQLQQSIRRCHVAVQLAELLAQCDSVRAQCLMAAIFDVSNAIHSFSVAAIHSSSMAASCVAAI